MANTTGKKFGGREKGTPNKQTKEIREAYKILIEANLSNMTNWISDIAKDNPEKAVDLLIKLSEYVVPKLNRTEIKDVTSLEDLLLLTPKQRQSRIITLKNQLNDEQSTRIKNIRRN
jgi:hypothetical protein